MRRLTATTYPQDLAGWYGPDSRAHGVCVDHEHLCLATVGFGPNNERRYRDPDGGWWNILCGEIIPLGRDEFGQYQDGRCGDFVYGSDFACPGHMKEIMERRARDRMNGLWY